MCERQAQAPERKLRVMELGPDRREAYEQFVSRHPHALLYHSLRFRDFLVELLGCSAHYAVAVRGREVAGVLPLMATDGPFGRVLNSLPYFGTNGGVLAGDEEARRALLAWYERRSAAAGVAAATVVANPLDPDAEAFPHDFVDSRIGHVTSLDPASTEEHVLAAVSGSARRNVNKALRSGVKVTVDNDALPDLETLHRESMTAIGGRPKGREFFAAVPRCFRSGEDYDLYVARVQRTVAAALLVFYYGSVVEYYVPATRGEHRTLQPMAAILSRALADAGRQGRTRWNWGGSWVTHQSLIRFKEKWGGRPRTYHYWTKVNAPEIEETTPARLLADYPGFYVLPFSVLRPPVETTG